MGTKLYIWKKEEKKARGKEQKKPEEGLYVPKLSESKLKDMSWSLDVLEDVTNNK